jgi:hypothetical protein
LISEVTGIVLQKSRNEKMWIEILTILEGVNYSVASTLLHFAFPDQYPILDFRTIWSLGIEKPCLENQKLQGRFTGSAPRLEQVHQIAGLGTEGKKGYR